MDWTRVESRPSAPGFAIFCLLVASVLVAVGFAVGETGFLVAAVPPGLMGTILFALRDPHTVVEFSPAGFTHEARGVVQKIPFEAIEKIWTPKRAMDPAKPGRAAYPITLAHASGVVHLPAKLDVESDHVYRHLIESVPVSGAREVHEDLGDYLAEQLAEFGDDRVWSYRASPRTVGASYRGFRLGATAAFVGGLVWLVYGIKLDEKSPWIPAGIVLMVFAGIFWLASFASGSVEVGGGSRFRGWKKSSLVVGPVGLALVQGDIRGEMKWDELLDVKLLDARSFRFSSQRAAGRGIMLKVEGASIFVPDIYDRPLFAIYSAIMRYWR